MSNILHFGAVDLRLTGSGVGRTSILGFDGSPTATLTTITMASAPTREVRRLSNLNSERARVKFETTAIDETFQITRITIWRKPLWTSYPQ